MSDYAVVIAARMGSDRLPGKVLAELAPGVTVLGQLFQRWRASDRNPTVICTTTTDAADNDIAIAASAAGVPVSRGDSRNVVAQMDLAVRTYAPSAKFVARALGDNPLVDVSLADWRLDKLEKNGLEGLWYGVYRDAFGVMRGRHELITYAGTTDVWSRPAWDRIVVESSGSQLEHPGEYYWHNIGKFQKFELPLPRNEYITRTKTELDEPLDLLMFRTLWQAWRDEFVDPDDAPDCVPTLWALKWLKLHPEVANINAPVRTKTQSHVGVVEREKPWVCEDCQGQIGVVKEGDLILTCRSCGKPRRFFSVKPKAHRRSLIDSASRSRLR